MSRSYISCPPKRVWRIEGLLYFYVFFTATFIEEHFIGRLTSMCLSVTFSFGGRQPILSGFLLLKSTNRSHCWRTLLCNIALRSQCSNDRRMVLEHIVDQQSPRMSVKQLPTIVVKNTFGMSACSREYTLPMILKCNTTANLLGRVLTDVLCCESVERLPGIAIKIRFLQL
jgi:hypothetical protein